MIHRWWKRDPAARRANPQTLGILALVAIHVATMGAFIALARADRQHQVQVGEVMALAREIESFARTMAGQDVRRPEALQTALAHFNAGGLFDAVRGVMEDGQIICSSRREEVGTAHWRGAALQDRWPQQPVHTWEHRGDPALERLTLSCPVPAPGGPRWLIEGVASPATPMRHSMAGCGWMLTLALGSVLIAAGVAVGLHRRLGPLAHIGTNLVRHQDELERELASLRLSSERGAVAEAWNRLIDLCRELQDGSSRQAAYQELARALRQGGSNEFLEAANVIPEGILHVVRGDRVHFINAMGSRLLGLADHTGNGQGSAARTLSDLGASPSGQRFVDAIRSAWQEDHFESRTVRIEDDDSTYRLRVLPVMWRKRGADGVVIISDISQAARAEKARDAFFRQATHELRTPLTNIRAYTETMSTMDDPAIQKECYNVIDKETRRLSRLVEELLSQSQIDLGTMQIRLDEVDLLALLDEAVRDLRATAEAEGITLAARLPSKMPRLRADRDKLAVVVSNLLGNALKYTPRGGSVTAECALAGENAEIRIRDTGIGIAPEHHEKVFEPLFRVDRAEVRNQVGSGVGLSTAREIVRQHGGDITVVSAADQGSEFVARLPLVARTVGEKARLL